MKWWMQPKSPGVDRWGGCLGQYDHEPPVRGIDPSYIRLEPYIPAFTELGPFEAKELGLKVNPQAEVYLLPSVASYVGGDVVAGVLVSRLHQGDELSLFVDIGTNGEMVLGSRDFLVACACSAGPAFEGSGITCGMRAMEGLSRKWPSSMASLRCKL